MKLKSLVFVILCIFGFCYHFSDVASVYFAFKTNTKIDIPLDRLSKMPALVFCTRYLELLDRSQYKKYRILKKSSNDRKKYHRDMEVLTVKDIFDLTPNEEEVLIGCQWRENNHDLTTFLKEQCLERLDITKYFDGGYICYQFSSRNFKMDRDCSLLSKSIFSEGEIYTVSLNKTFRDKAHVVKIIDHLPIYSRIAPLVMRLPYVSQRFAFFNHRFKNYEKKASDDNYYFVTNEVYSIQRLQFPYDSGCTDDFNVYRHTCFRNCNMKSYRQEGLVPGNEFILDPVDLRHFSFKDILNTSLVDRIANRTSHCLKLCTKNFCSDGFSVTTAVIMPYSMNQTISIAAGCPTRPSVRIKFIPMMNTYEFILFTCSCFGIWFGVSVISLNPFGSRMQALVRKFHFKKNRIHQFRDTLPRAVKRPSFEVVD